jgi:hypothetical protein
MRTERQFTTFLENKPGRLLTISSALAKRKVSIVALTVVDSHEHSVLRFVVDDSEGARDVLKKTGTPFTESDVIAIELKSQPGTLASMCEKLAAQHVNIDYVYCSSSGKNGKTIVFMKATPADKLRQLFSEAPGTKVDRLPVRPVRRQNGRRA